MRKVLLVIIIFLAISLQGIAFGKTVDENLQATLDMALPGNLILFEAGVTSTDNFWMTAESGSSYLDYHLLNNQKLDYLHSNSYYSLLTPI
jgi:hypothetical protein